MPLTRSIVLMEKSSTLPKPSVAIFSLLELARASSSSSCQVLKRLFWATKMNDGPWSMTATGVISSMVQRGSLPASRAWLSAM